MRKKVLVVLSLLMLSWTISAQECTKCCPQGAKGIVANFSNFDLSTGLGNYKINSLDLGFSGYYFLFNDFCLNAGLGWGLEKADNNDTYNTFNYTVGIRQYFPNVSWFLGAWYEGFTAKNTSYENGLRIDCGYTLFVTKDIFVEPCVYWERTFEQMNINKIGLGLSLGLAF